MSFNGYMAWLVCQEQNAERLRKVARYRLVRQALAARRQQALAARRRQAATTQRGRDRVLIRAQTWLGRCLVAWGRRLQERYDVVVESPTLHAANHAGN